MKTGIIVAMDKEYDSLVRILDGRNEGRLDGHDIRLAVAGIGKVNAAVTAAAMILDFRPDCVISTGVAGGLSAEMKAGDVVIGRQTAYHDVDCGSGNLPGQVQGQPQRFDADVSLIPFAKKVLEGAWARTPGRYFEGLIATGDQFVFREDAPAILAKYPDALAADMESAALAQTCYRYGVPFLSIRMVSDVIAPDLSGDNFEQYKAFFGMEGNTL